MTNLVLYDIPQKDPKINIWMAFPAISSFGMSSLGYMSIVKTLDLRSDYFVEKIFTDTTNTLIRPQDVDVMGFSVSFEMDFLGIFSILDKHKIPLKSKDRDESHPLIFAGGPVLTANPEPYSDFFDFIIIGDAENIDTNIIDYIKNNIELSKAEKLDILSKQKGIYVPSLTVFDEAKGVLKADETPACVEKITSQLSSCISTPVLSENSFFANSYVVEIVRGCPQRCGFLIAPHVKWFSLRIEWSVVLKDKNAQIRIITISISAG